MRFSVWVSFLLMLFTACTPVGAASTFNVQQEPQMVEKIEISMDKGQVEFRSGATVDVSGQIQTNQPALEPKFIQEGERFFISQPVLATDLSPQKKSVINNWQLRFGKNLYDLKIQTEAIQGVIDLSGVALKNLEILERGSTYDLVLSEVNPAELEKFVYLSKASNVNLTGMANLNTGEMILESIGGRYVVDFSGEIQQEMDVKVAIALGSLILEIPADLNTHVTLAGNYQQIIHQGDWDFEGKHFYNHAEGPLVDIFVEMDVGSLSLVLLP